MSSASEGRQADRSLRILWLKTGPLHPLDTGGKIRTFNMLRTLSRVHNITFLSLYPEGSEESARTAAVEYSQQQIWVPMKEVDKRSLAFIGQLLANLLTPSAAPLAVSRYTHPELERHLVEQATPDRHDLVICDFLAPAENVLRISDSIGIPIVLFQHNVESNIWLRLCQNAPDPFRRAVLRNQHGRMRRFEEQASRKMSGVITVSPDDSDTFRRQFSLTNILGDVPTGVDTDYFQEVARAGEPCGLVFLGSMDWHANIDGVRWFVETVYPQIRSAFQEVTLTIVGRRPPPEILDLAAQDASITVTGTVDDVRPYLSAGAVLIVPLRVGGGTRIKIFEAMAAGIPVVATRIGAEGLPAVHGEHLLLADEADDFANSALALLTDREQANQLAASALELVRSRYTWEAVADEFTRHCRRVLRDNA